MTPLETKAVTALEAACAAGEVNWTRDPDGNTYRAQWRTVVLRVTVTPAALFVGTRKVNSGYDPTTTILASITAQQNAAYRKMLLALVGGVE